MDEIDWVKNIKKAFIFCSKIFLFMGAFSIVMLLLGALKNGWESVKVALLFVIAVSIGFPLIMGIGYLIILMILKILYSGKKVVNFDKRYIRDLPNHCSPAICSLIHDLKIDVYKDYTATILYLCIKKYINLIKDGKTYRLELVKDQDYSNLGQCEKYVLNVLDSKTKFDENQFKNEIIKEAQGKELITDKRHSKTPKILLMLIVIIAALIITYNINIIVFYIIAGLTGMIAIVGWFAITLKIQNEALFDVTDTQYIRTKDGKEIALLLDGLKRYIKEYTLIKEKEIDYMQILEEYIPYALALEEADAVEEFIKYNEEYRGLIYNKKA